MPKNGECNFWLGEVYKKMDKPRRAWSRYFQSILDKRVPESIREDSLARLDELNSDPQFRKTFSMIVAEQYMAGRLEDAEFHAKSRYQQVKKKFPGHVKLVEFFSDSNDASTGGMQLAFQALDEFFKGDVALIGYHLNDPMHSDAAKSRLEYYGTDSTPLAVFDGKPVLKSNVSVAKKLCDNAAENDPAFRNASLYKEPYATDKVNLSVALGSSPRGIQSMILLGKVRALINGRFAVSCQDIRDVAVPVLRHRIMLSFEGFSERVNIDELIREIVGSVEELSD